MIPNNLSQNLSQNILNRIVNDSQQCCEESIQKQDSNQFIQDIDSLILFNCNKIDLDESIYDPENIYFQNILPKVLKLDETSLDNHLIKISSDNNK